MNLETAKASELPTAMQLFKQDTHPWTQNHQRRSLEERLGLLTDIQLTGNEEALSQLIGCYFPMILSCAKRTAYGNDILDHIQSGAEGFSDAAKHKVDLQKVSDGTDPSKYLKSWVRYAMRKFATETFAPFTLPFGIFGQYCTIKRLEREFTPSHGRSPNPRELSELSGYPIDEVKFILQTVQSPLYLSMPKKFGDSDKPKLLEDTLSATPKNSTYTMESSAAEQHSVESTPTQKCANVLLFMLESVKLSPLQRKFIWLYSLEEKSTTFGEGKLHMLKIAELLHIKLPHTYNLRNAALKKFKHADIPFTSFQKVVKEFNFWSSNEETE